MLEGKLTGIQTTRRNDAYNRIPTKMNYILHIRNDVGKINRSTYYGYNPKNYLGKFIRTEKKYIQEK